MKATNILMIFAVLFAVLILSGGAFGYYVTDPVMCPNARNPFKYALSLSDHNIPCKTTQDCRDAGSGGYCLQNGWINGSCGQQLCGDSGSPNRVNGGWSSWQDSSSCSQVCDGGTKTQVRYCNNPAPSNGGSNCSGSSTRTVSCNTQQCFIGAPSLNYSISLSGDHILSWTTGYAQRYGIRDYAVYESTNQGAFLPIITTTSTTHTLSSPPAEDTNYDYYVLMTSNQPRSVTSNIVEVSGATGPYSDTTPPIAPVLAEVPPMNDGNFVLDWSQNPGSDPESGVSHYLVWYNFDDGNFSLLADNDLNLFYSVVNNSPDGNYGYFVQAFNNAGLDTNSNTVYSYTDSGNIIAPILANIPPYNVGNFSLDWSQNPGFDSIFGVNNYVVWWRLDSTPWQIMASTMNMIYNVAGMQTVDGNYNYFVQLIGNSGRDINSGIVSSIMDTVAPNVNILNPGVWWRTSDFNIGFIVDFGLSGQNTAKYQVDGNGWQNLASDFNLLINVDGNHLIDYNFVDNSGNIATGTFYSARDATAPIVSINNPGAEWTNLFYNVNFDVDFGSSGRGLAQYQINNSGWNNFVFDFNVPMTIDGNHTIDYNFVDLAGNITNGTITTGLDTTSPTISSITNSGSSWQIADFNIQFNGVNFNISGINTAEYQIDGNGWQAFTLTNGTDFNAPITTDGNHRVDYRFIDNADNITQGTIYSALDKGPVIINVFNTGLPWRNLDFNVEYIIDFSVSGQALAQYNLNGSGWQNFTTDFNIPILIDGNYLIDTNFCNNAGTCAQLISTTFLDKTSPTINITNPGATWFAGDFNVQFTDINFDISGMQTAQYRINDGGWQNITGDFNIPIITDGNQSIEYYLEDLATNITSGKIFALRDTNSVSVIITNLGAGWTNNDYTIDFIVDFGTSGQALSQYRIDSGVWQNFTTDFNILFNTEGSHNVDYNFCNNAGNCANGTQFTGLDKTAPTIGSIINPGAISSVPNDFNIEFINVNFDISGRASAQYQINDNGWQNFTTDFIIPITMDGNNEVSYRFIDNAGNIKQGIIYSTRDTGVVFVSIINSGTTWQSSPYNVNFLVDFGGSGQALAQYNLNGSGWQNFTTDFNVPIMINGANNVDYNFCNNAGNCVEGSLTARLDTFAPSFTSITNLGTSWQTTDHNIIFNGINFSVSGMQTAQYRINPGVWIDFNGIYEIPITIDGNNLIDYNFVNNALNSTSGTFYSARDVTEPLAWAINPVPDSNTIILTPTISAGYSDNISIDMATVQLYLNGTIVPATITSTTATYTPPVLLEGTYDANIIISDYAGNTTNYGWEFNIVSGWERNLSITDYSATSTINLGETADLNVELINNGNANETTSVRLFVDGIEQSSQQVNLNIGDSTIINFNYTPITQGTYTLLVAIDPVPGELIFVDNNIQSLLTVGNGIAPMGNGLRISQINFSDYFPNEGDLVTIIATIMNDGATTINQNIDVTFYDSIGEIQTETIMLTLAPNETTTSMINWNTTNRAGYNDLLVFVDSNNSLSEDDETNNTATTVVFVNPPISPGFDIVVENLEFNSPVTNGETVNVSAIIRSENQTLVNVPVIITIGSNIIYSELLNLTADTNYEINASWVSSIGSYQLNVLADPSNIFVETNEGNNTLTGTLVVNAPTGQTTPSSGGSSNTSWIVGPALPAPKEPVEQEQLPSVNVCSPSELENCFSQSECENMGGIWQNNECVSSVSEENSNELDDSESRIVLMPGNLIISDTNTSSLATGFFGLGETETTLVYLLFAIMIIGGVGAFFVITPMGNKIVKNFKK
jgi:hypothetical protein